MKNKKIKNKTCFSVAEECYKNDPAKLEHYKKQREEQGFDDTETWHLDKTVALFLLPRLKRYIQVNNGFPGGMTEESFNEKSTKPYGVSVFYKELPKLFKDKKFRTIYYTPSTYLYANSKEGYGEHEASGNFVIIGNSDYLDNYDINKLLDWSNCNI